MISRLTREAAGGVLSFTFLDVLTCTMGSLVLLVVILGEKAADTRLEDALRHGPKTGASQSASTGGAIVPTAGNSDDPSQPSASDVAAQLEAFRKHEAELAALRERAAQRLEDETARVRHLEEHQRRLEHELAQLNIVLERLEETEKQNSVDQVTAERDLERLKQLLADTEKQLKEIRSQPAGKKSYAIIPYEGKFGTHRRPIYIECTKDAAIIQPEGLEFTLDDLNGPIRSGNPLASAVRAAHYELNERARAAGQQEMPDPYPLILVRPEGAVTFWVVQRAIESWDVQYGYELIEADWDLEFPEIDPRLLDVMSHAADQARTRQAVLARAAPRTYGGGRGRAVGPIARADAASADERKKQLQLHGAPPTGAAGNAVGGQVVAGAFGSLDSPSSGGGTTASGAAAEEGEPHFGQANIGGKEPAGNFADQFGPPGGNGQKPPADATASATPTALSPGAASPSGAGSSMPAAIDVHATPTEAEGRDGGQPGSATQTANQESPPTNDDDGQRIDSAATSRGSNWANLAATQRATPVTRPIHVLVSTDQLQLLSDDGPNAPASIVSFHQPTDDVLDDLAAAVKNHVESWGLAGKSMYWRPTLVLQVAPGAERHAIGLNDLLRDSGVDVRFQEVETAAKPAGESSNGTR